MNWFLMYWNGLLSVLKNEGERLAVEAIAAIVGYHDRSSLFIRSSRVCCGRVGPAASVST